MKVHTNNLKTALKNAPIVTDEKITYGNTTLTNEQIIDVQPHFKGSLLKTMMKSLEIQCTTDIAKNTIINYQEGILVNNAFEYLNFGNYVVVSSEKNEETNSYTITCYDKLIYSAVDYVDLGLTYPITLGNYLNAICTYLGLTLKTTTFTNSTLEIEEELYLNLGYKFRDVLDEISQATGGSICLDINDKVEIRVPTATNDTIDEDLILDLSTKFKNKYGPINTLVLSRSAESDNIYYPSTLPENPIEVKIIDNQILNGNNRSDFMQGIASNIFGIEFYENDFTSQGIFYYDFLDKYNVSTDNITYNCIMFNNDISIANGTENIYSQIPDTAETDYSKADTTDKKINQAYVMVDKQNQKIEAKVSQDEIISSLNLAIEDGQGIVYFKGNLFVVDADNLKIDTLGRVKAYNLDILGGNIILRDNGTQENASIKIETPSQYTHFIDYNIDLENKKIKFNLADYTYQDIRDISNYELFITQIDNTQYEFHLSVSTIMINEYEESEELYLEIWIRKFINNEFIESKEILLKQVENNDLTQLIKDNFEVVLSNTISPIGTTYYVTGRTIKYDILVINSEVIRKTAFNGNGMIADIIPDYTYTNNDVIRVDQIISGSITPTEEDYNKYDLDRDGTITSNDRKIINYYISLNITPSNPGKFILNTQSIENNLVLKDGNENEKINIGLATGIKINEQILLPPTAITIRGTSENKSYTISNAYGWGVNLILTTSNSNEKTGDDFELDTDDSTYSQLKIKNNAKINHLEISANVMLGGQTNRAYILLLTKNWNTEISSTYVFTNHNSWITLSLVPTIIEASPGDTFQLYLSCSSANSTANVASSRFTYLTAKKID